MDSAGVPDACDTCPWDFNPDRLDGDGFEERVISEEVDGPWSVCGADVDGDGDAEVRPYVFASGELQLTTVSEAVRICSTRR